MEFAWLGIPVSAVGLLYLISPFCRKPLGVPRQVMLSPGAGRTAGSRTPEDRGRGALRRTAGPSSRRCWWACHHQATGWIPLGLAAVPALCCASSSVCSPPGEAIRAIDWSTIFLFAGTLALAEALETDRRRPSDCRPGWSPCAAERSTTICSLRCCSCSCGLITQFMSNTVACALLAPNGLQIAGAGGLPPRAC